MTDPYATLAYFCAQGPVFPLVAGVRESQRCDNNIFQMMKIYVRSKSDEIVVSVVMSHVILSRQNLIHFQQNKTCRPLSSV